MLSIFWISVQRKGEYNEENIQIFGFMPTYYSLYVLHLGSEAKGDISKGELMNFATDAHLLQRTNGGIQKERTQAIHAIAHI